MSENKNILKSKNMMNYDDILVDQGGNTWAKNIDKKVDELVSISSMKD